MHFEEIAQNLRDGEAVKRKSWQPGKFICINLHPAFSGMTHPYFLMQDYRGEKIPYALSAEDFLAQNWEVV